MRVTVTPTCNHKRLKPEDRRPGTMLDHDFTSQGNPIVGRRLLVTPDGVWVDGKPAILRDRRAKVNREPGHPWTTSNDHPDPKYRRISWTGFTVDVEP